VELSTIVTTLALTAGGFLVLSTVAGALPLAMMSHATLVRLNDDSARQFLRRVLSAKIVTPQWLLDKGFEPMGVFQLSLQGLVMVVWQLRGERTFLAAYVIQSRVIPSFITEFEQGSLTTGISRDGLMVPPRPAHWLQAFRSSNIEDQWSHHLDALEFLRGATSQTPKREPIADFAAYVLDWVRAHAAYTRSKPLWFLRIPYWYFVRRSSLYGKSVREQHLRMDLS
jgi:hypothetical protein